MKYAIVEISGKQFWVETGKYYDFNKIPTELGKQITLNRVLLLNDEGNILIGHPYLKTVKMNLITIIILIHLNNSPTKKLNHRVSPTTHCKEASTFLGSTNQE